MPRITIRVPFGLLEQIDAAAKKAKRNRSDWLRLQAEDAVKEPAKNSDSERAIELLKKVAVYSWRTNKSRYVRLDYSIQQEIDEFLHIAPRLPDVEDAVIEPNEYTGEELAEQEAAQERYQQEQGHGR